MAYGSFRSPGGESNHTLPYNNEVSLHVGPVRVLGGRAEAEIVAFTSKAGARSTAPIADAAKFTLIRWSASIDSLPARGRGRCGRELPFFGTQMGNLAAAGRPSEPIKCFNKATTSTTTTTTTSSSN